MNNVFDITDFGAVGDGKTVSTNAIQEAIDKASLSHGTVIVPPGVYLTGALKLKGGILFQGDGAWPFRSNGVSVLSLCDESAEYLLDITGAFGCTVKGISFDGNNIGKNIHCIHLHWDRYNGGDQEDTPTIEDCRIANFSGDGIHFEKVWCFSVRHSMLCFNGGTGLYVHGWDGFILDNWFSCNARGGIVSGPTVASLTITGNRVEWNRRAGFYLIGGDSYNITGNFFDRTFGPALMLGTSDKGCNSITINSNIFRRNGTPDGPFEDIYDSCHIRMTNCENVTICANSFIKGENDGGGGELSPDYSLILTDNKSCIIKDNAMHNAQIKDTIISFGDNSSVLIKDNMM